MASTRSIFDVCKAPVIMGRFMIAFVFLSSLSNHCTVEGRLLEKGIGRGRKHIGLGDIADIATDDSKKCEPEGGFIKMGGSIGKFLHDMKDMGDITEEQRDHIQYKILGNPSFIQDQGQPVALCAETKVAFQEYLVEEEASGRMRSDVKQYIWAMFRFPEKVQPVANLLSSSSVGQGMAATAAYTGNGNVNRLDRIDPDTSNILYNGIWGFAHGEREYALQGDDTGLHIIDVTNTPCYRVQFISMPGGNSWRDMETYKQASTGNIYAYVAAQDRFTTAHLWVVNLSALSSTTTGNGVDSNPIQSSDYINRNYNQYGHTLTVGAGLLMLNTAGRSNGCTILDVESNPWNPPELAEYSGTGRECHDSHVRTGVMVDGVAKDLLYSADGSGQRMRILDVTNIRNSGTVTQIGQSPSVSNTYFHSSTSTEDDNYMFVCEENNQYDILVYDVSDQTTPQLLGSFQYSGEGSANSIVHNAKIRGNYLHVAYYKAGYRVFDISNVYNIIEVGKSETWRDPDDDGINERSINSQFDGAWNVAFLPSGNVLVSDTESGTLLMEVTDASPPNPPTSLSAVPSATEVQLSWTAPSAGEIVTGYRVYRKTSPGGTFEEIVTNLLDTTLQYIDTNVDLTSSYSYYYIVVAFNGGGESSSSNEVSVVSSTDVPTSGPSSVPSGKPSFVPSSMPSESFSPSNIPSDIPSFLPSAIPSISLMPTKETTNSPSRSNEPSASPSDVPSTYPSKSPSNTPSAFPSNVPSLSPSKSPSSEPSLMPSLSMNPTAAAPEWVQLTYDDFENGWGTFNDGGSDAFRYTRDTHACGEGTDAIRIRDNSGVGSSMTQDVLVVSGYSELRVSFKFRPVGMENGEDFWLQLSGDGGVFGTYGTWVSGTDFSNNNCYSDEVVIDVSSYSNVQVRFRCDASHNNDRIFIDDVTVEGKV